MTIEMVFLDIGGVLYDDTVYARAWHRALRDAGAHFTDADFDQEYARARTEQSGSFRRRLMARFLPDGDLRELETLAGRYWHYPPSALYDDAVPCLEELQGRYRLGVIANQPGEVRTALHRDGLEPFFEVWGVSDDLGVGKPDPALFELAVKAAGVAPGTSVMVGDRLDYDMRPAAQVGMRTIWMLRGEAPDEPTPAQLAETDGAIRSLTELPSELEGLSTA
ncbi:MAG TPA: HAD family hydrolase [Actinomycetota bacterium]|nr:HAD family hydrolase [Actinomycetota bacterium]